MSQEITHLKESLQSARTESSAAAERLAQTETGKHALVHKTESLTAQCKQLANHNEWLNAEVERKGIEHREFRKEKGDQVAKLQQDVDRLTHEANSASLKCAGFEKKANDLEGKYTLAVDKIKLVCIVLSYCRLKRKSCRMPRISEQRWKHRDNSLRSLRERVNH